MSAVETIPQIIDPNTHVIRRVNLPDLSEKGQWLVDRLREKYPQHSDASLMSWLRSLTSEDNSRHFVRTERAFGLSEIRTDRMTAPVVVERFVLLEEGADISEGQALYLDIARWAENLGASDVALNNKSDVPRDFMEECLGKLVERKQLFYRVGK